MQWSISDKEMSESSQPDFGSPHNHCIFGWIGGGGGVEEGDLLCLQNGPHNPAVNERSL